jgi:ketosteroid isomerase-like protein
MSVEENKAIVRQAFETAERGTLEGLDEIVAPDLLEQWEQGIAWTLKTFPGHRQRITDMVAEGDHVWARVATSGGYAGGWMGIPATEGQWDNTGVWFLQLFEGKIVKAESLFNVLGHLRQLGAKVVPGDA